MREDTTIRSAAGTARVPSASQVISPTARPNSQDAKPRPADSVAITVSSEAEDTAWDEFVAGQADGHHVQTSLWGQVKAALGWRAVRVIVRQQGTIVDGLQLLMRPVSFLGSVGYVPKGPLFPHRDFELARQLLNETLRVAKAHRVRFLVVQPPNHGELLADHLCQFGFRASNVEAIPTATTVIDLRLSEEEILSNMKAKTRYNIRLGERSGVRIRDGKETDLPLFYQMLGATAKRQQFDDYSLDYFRTMADVFGTRGHFKLFIAEHQGEPLSALLAIPFGNTVLFKKGGWSGRHGQLHPNESMHWTAIRWAKAKGYRYYDFEGIDSDAANMVLEGKPLPRAMTDSVTRFKLGFGGPILVNPGTFDYVPSRFLRWSYQSAYPKIANSSLTRSLIRGLQRR